jgi:hypothetical protein
MITCSPFRWDDCVFAWVGDEAIMCSLSVLGRSVKFDTATDVAGIEAASVLEK